MKAITVALSFFFVFAVLANDQQMSPSISKAQNNKRQGIDQYDNVDTEKSNLRHLQSGPNSGKRMAQWKKVHNDMRKKYHVEYGGEFTRILWNMELKKDAEVWANEIVSNCVNRAPGPTKNPNNYGVNSAMRRGQRGFQSPITVMKMWERRLPQGYPTNSVMTQVLWSKTGYVGCADASSPVGAEKSCTASVCFYAKAGNCAFGRFGGTGNWTQAVLYGPACSTSCPSTVEEC